MARWRDDRLREVLAASVKREMHLLSAALNVACREWGWIDANPLSMVRKPPSSAPRDRRISPEEIEAIVSVCGTDLSKIAGRIGLAFLFAIETAMRAGEIIGLEWSDIDLEKRVAHLAMTKNGTARQVPLSRRAMDLLEMLPKTERRCFDLTSRQRDVGFRRVREKAGLENLHFHDTRHEAITRLASRLDVLSLARVVGHRDIRMLQVYYNETEEELAARLD